jgi:hypothetical protein
MDIEQFVRRNMKARFNCPGIFKADYDLFNPPKSKEWVIDLSVLCSIAWRNECRRYLDGREIILRFWKNGLELLANPSYTFFIPRKKYDFFLRVQLPSITRKAKPGRRGGYLRGMKDSLVTSL